MSNEIPLPPKELQLTSGPFVENEYISHGIKQANSLIKHGIVRSNYNVLDVGCGNGRVARHLIELIDQYQGIDISPENIDWAKENISSVAAHFSFRTIEPGGKFPYADNSFDSSFARSLYTHLDDETTRFYLTETARVTKPGSYSWATFFSIEREADLAMPVGKHELLRKVKKEKEGFFTFYRPEINRRLSVFTYNWLVTEIENAGFEIINSPLSQWFSGSTPSHPSDAQVPWIFRKK